MKQPLRRFLRMDVFILLAGLFVWLTTMLVLTDRLDERMDRFEVYFQEQAVRLDTLEIETALLEGRFTIVIDTFRSNESDTLAK